MNGLFFQEANGDCYKKVGGKNFTILDYGNGDCDEAFNFPECNFDGGDCLIPNLIKEADITSMFPNCDVPWKSFIGKLS